MFLVRMKPTNENVGSDSVVKVEISDRDVSDVGLQISPTRRCDFEGQFAYKP